MTKIGDPGGHRLTRWWRSVQWPLLMAVALGAVALGIVGFTAQYHAAGTPLTALDAVYKSLQLFVLEWGGADAPVPILLEVARLLAPLVAGLAAAKALAILFRDELGRLRLRFLIRGHVVVCGLGTKGRALAGSLYAAGWKVAAIGIDEGRGRPDGVIVITGDATDPSTLERAGVARAAHVVALCGSDATNAAVAREVHSIANPALVTHVLIRDSRLAALLRSETIISTTEGTRSALEFFAIEETGARILIDLVSPKAADNGVLVIVGLGRFGSSVLIEAARRRWGFATPRAITVVDADAENRVNGVLHRHPGVGRAAKVTPIALTSSSAEFDRARFLVDESGVCQVAAVLVCLEDEGAALSAGLVLVQRLKETTRSRFDRPIEVVVCASHASSLADLVAGSVGEDDVARLRTFDPIAASLNPSLLTAGSKEAIAAAIHAVYFTAHASNGPRPGGSPALLPWVDLGEEYRESSRAAADGVGPGLRSIGCALVLLVDWDADPITFTPSEVELMAILEHRRWIAWKREHGFRRSEDSDPALRTKAHLVPWDELSEATRERVRAFVRSLPRVLADGGQRVVRLD